jgi:hypothetical protein
MDDLPVPLSPSSTTLTCARDEAREGEESSSGRGEHPAVQREQRSSGPGRSDRCCTRRRRRDAAPVRRGVGRSTAAPVDVAGARPSRQSERWTAAPSTARDPRCQRWHATARSCVRRAWRARRSSGRCQRRPAGSTCGARRCRPLVAPVFTSRAFWMGSMVAGGSRSTRVYAARSVSRRAAQRRSRRRCYVAGRSPLVGGRRGTQHARREPQNPLMIGSVRDDTQRYGPRSSGGTRLPTMRARKCGRPPPLSQLPPTFAIAKDTPATRNETVRGRTLPPLKCGLHPPPRASVAQRSTLPQPLR